jgi:hypothetical protein
MFHILRPPSAATLIKRQLARADSDFLEAAANAEHWAALADMLARRRERLASYLRPPEPPPCVSAQPVTTPGLSSQPESASIVSTGATSAEPVDTAGVQPNAALSAAPPRG